jgi:hypothetical protein
MSVVLSHRLAAVITYVPEMSYAEHRKLVDTVNSAESFEQLPANYQEIILAAEANALRKD